MAHSDRAPAIPVAQRPTPKGGRVRDHFLQWVRRKEWADRHLPRIGEAARPADESIRFGQDPSVAFTAATITGLSEADEHGRVRVATGFFGMLGAEGPLPLFVTEYVRTRWLHNRDSTLMAFLDMFHHRLASLFYRAWANSQPVVSRDRPEDDRFASYVSALVGFRQEHATHRSHLARDYRLYQAHHLIARGRNPQGLLSLVQEYFRVQAQVEEFSGGWLTLPDRYCTKLGPHLTPLEQRQSTLGGGARLGTQVYNRAHRFRLVIGPLTRAQMENFRSEDGYLPALRELVRCYIGDELEWDIRLVPASNQHAPARLGEGAILGRASYLGRPSLANQRPLQDVIINPDPASSPSNVPSRQGNHV